MNIDDDDETWGYTKCLGVDYPPVNVLQIKTSQKLGMIEGQSVTVLWPLIKDCYVFTKGTHYFNDCVLTQSPI